MDKAQAEKLIDDLIEAHQNLINAEYMCEGVKLAEMDLMGAREPILSALTGEPAPTKDQALRDALGEWLQDTHAGENAGATHWNIPAIQSRIKQLLATPTGEAQAPTPADPLPLGPIDPSLPDRLWKSGKICLFTPDGQVTASFSPEIFEIKRRGEGSKGATAADLALMDAATVTECARLVGLWWNGWLSAQPNPMYYREAHRIVEYFPEKLRALVAPPATLGEKP